MQVYTSRPGRPVCKYKDPPTTQRVFALKVTKDTL